MPEIKNTFVQGKMNKDLDERLLPNGEYRDAMNIQVTTSEGSDVGTVQNVFGNERISDGINNNDFKCIGSITDEKNDTIYWFITNKIDNIDAILEYKKDLTVTPIFIDTTSSVLKFPDRIITGINIIDDFLFWTDSINEPKKISISRCKQGTTGTIDNPSNTKLIVNDEVVKDADGNDVEVAERNITVIKKKPTSPPNVKINLTSATTKPSLFEKTFCRFAYRYKYEDGEYSAFGPFTDIVFNPTYPNGIDSDTVLSVKEPYNRAMVSSIDSIDIYDFVSPDIPNDVVQVDILYKQENSPVIFSIASVKPDDPVPTGYQYNYWNDFGFNQNNAAYTNSGYKGKYPIVSENIYAAVPSNQLLRPWDNVPKKALAQEVTGSRIVYANYTQNYDLGVTPGLSVDYINRDQYQPSDFSLGGVRSLKSQRNYQLGVIFGDEYGRETPVFTSTDGAVKIPWEKGGMLSASQSYQLKTHLNSTLPDWADYYKFYVKETSTEYYNLVMDKAYSPTSDIIGTEGAIGEDNHIWVSFPSSDRNKLTEEDYIILKRKIKPGENQFPIENRFKILDIKNEAPDAIKFHYMTLGTHANKDGGASGSYNGILDNGGNLSTAPGFNSGLYTSDVHRMDVSDNTTIWLDKSNFEASVTGDGASLINSDDAQNSVKNLYISWHDQDTLETSKRYRISDIRVSNPGTSAVYVMTLAESITSDDATLASNTSNSDRLNENLVVKIERKDTKDMDQFSGRFFVKVVSQEGVTGDLRNVQDDLLDTYIINMTQDVTWWADPEATTAGDPTTGIINSNAYNTTLPDTTQSSTDQNLNDIAGFSGTLTTSTSSAANTYTNNVSNWDLLAGFHSGFSAKASGGHFFIDNLTFVAGQCANNFFARNAGDPIKGNTTIYGEMEWSNALDTSQLALGSGGPTPTIWTQDPQMINYYPRIMSGQQFQSAIDHIVQIFVNSPQLESPNDAHEGNSTKFYRTVAEGTYRWKPFAKDSKDGWDVNNNNGQGFLVNNFDGANSAITEDRIWTTTSLGLATTATSGGFVHAIDGLIQTTDEHTDVDGIKRWRAEGELNTGTWNQDNTYGNGSADNGKIFLHLSFLAPGENLLPDTLTIQDIAGCGLRGINSLGTKLQGIWGGGIFTKEDGTIIADASRKARILELEGNYTTDSGDSNASSDEFTLSGAPGPGVGQGYDTNYADQHYNQWDPAWPAADDTNGEIANFVNAIQAGSKFVFKADASNTIYTIKSLSKKRLYNHTPWRRRFVWDQSGGQLVASGNSVEEAAIAWAEAKNVAGAVTVVGSELYYANILKERLENFAKASNRRVCYILEIDKDPTDPNVTPFNPVEGTATLDAGVELDGTGMSGIQFIQSDPRAVIGRVSTTPAIWETEPKGNADLDIYYEASGAIPCKLNEKNAEVFAPIGCKIKFNDFPDAINGGIIIDANQVYLSEWTLDNGSLLFTANPGFNDLDSSGNTIDYAGKKVRFIRQDGSYTTGTILANNTTVSGDYRTHFEIDPDIDPKNETGLSWYNCFSFGNGIESDRIRDDFNEMQILNGARASTTTEEPYQEEHRKYGLIFSGLYNSNSGLNELNQFIMADKITKDINPTYGSIQKLFSRNTDLVTFCEDRVVKILANKDAVFNADGKPQLTANINVLGQTIPFIGDYGISKNPESFAKESYRAYFTDKARGAVLRLSNDGLTPISDAGMHDYFRDNFALAGSLVGTYDAYKQNYNLTLKQPLTSNVITNADIGQGTEVVSTTITGDEILTNTLPIGTNLSYSNVLPLDPGTSTSNSYAGILNPVLNTQPVVTEYPAIAQGHFQQADTFSGTVDVEAVTNTDFSSDSDWTMAGDATNYAAYTNAQTYISIDDTATAVSITGSGFNPSTGSTYVSNISDGILTRKNVNTTGGIVSNSNNTGTYSNGSARQTISVENGVTYTCSYSYRIRSTASNPTINPNPNTEISVAAKLNGSSFTFNLPGSQVTAPTTVIQNPGQYQYSVDVYDSRTFTFTPSFTGGMEIAIYFIGSTEADINNFSVTSSVAVSGGSIPDIPDAPVAAWAQVSTSINDWVIDQPEHVTFANFETIYGTANEAVAVTATGQQIDANGTVTPDGNTYSWFAPAPNGITTVGQYTPGSQSLLDDIIDIDCPSATNQTITISQTLGTAMEVGDWYMLDVVYDSNNVTTDGVISIEGVLDTSLVAGLEPGDHLVDGTSPGDYPEGHLGKTLGLGELQLAKTLPDATIITKKYYTGDTTTITPGQNTDTVYRAIFKLASNTDITTLAVKFKDFEGEIKGIWLNELGALSTGGDINADWNAVSLRYYLDQLGSLEYTDNSGTTPVNKVERSNSKLHSLMVPDKYFKDGKFNFNKSKHGRLEQSFTNNATLGGNHPLPTNEGYELLFTIDDAVSHLDSTALPVSGRFYGDVSGQDGSGNYTGFKFSTSTTSLAKGRYRITGNFDGTTTPTAEIYDDTLGAFVSTSTFNSVALLTNATQSRIRFQYIGPTTLTCAVKDFSLRDKTTVLSGGTADAWSFSGFDSTLNDYIVFDNESITFNNAPTTAQAEQNLANVINPDVGHKYRVKFDHALTSGTFSGSVQVYYFNSSGKGFKFNASGTDTYDEVHTIGDDTASASQLLNTFVIRALSPGGTSGTIDNILMQQVVVDGFERTVSYTEKIRGWTSFKSFIPESGVSMSKKYYTMNEGKLFEHHSNNVNRNQFYGVDGHSTVTTVLNQAPSTIKTFNTLNYEGSQSKILKYHTAYEESVTPYNLEAKDGWYVEYLKTDKQEGTVKEFIEKEGKWFNYIRGNVTDIKTAAFSFQGLGIIETVT